MTGQKMHLMMVYKDRPIAGDKFLKRLESHSNTLSFKYAHNAYIKS